MKCFSRQQNKIIKDNYKLIHFKLVNFYVDSHISEISLK